MVKPLTLAFGCGEEEGDCDGGGDGVAKGENAVIV
jgi:hypothetical protein